MQKHANAKFLLSSEIRLSMRLNMNIVSISIARLLTANVCTVGTLAPGESTQTAEVVQPS